MSVLQESEQTEHVKEPKLPKLRKVPKHIDGGVQSHVYQTPKEPYSQIFFLIIDCISGEITIRFDQPSFTFIQSVEKILIDAANGKEVQIPPAVTECHRNDLDFDRPSQQLRSLYDLCDECC